MNRLYYVLILPLLFSSQFAAGQVGSDDYHSRLSEESLSLKAGYATYSFKNTSASSPSANDGDEIQFGLQYRSKRVGNMAFHSEILGGRGYGIPFDEISRMSRIEVGVGPEFSWVHHKQCWYVNAKGVMGLLTIVPDRFGNELPDDVKYGYVGLSVGLGCSLIAGERIADIAFRVTKIDDSFDLSNLQEQDFSFEMMMFQFIAGISLE